MLLSKLGCASKSRQTNNLFKKFLKLCHRYRELTAKPRAL
jgi:t-SNARE complex subunit (syntaxin)